VTATRPASASTAVSPTTKPVAATDTAPPATRPTTTVAATEAPTTTVPPTTTTTAPPPVGWTPTDFVPGAFPVGYSGNWSGSPSPAAPTDPAQPLADGYYDAQVITPWSASNPGVLQVELHRYELCTVLPEGACEPNPDDPTEIGLDPAWSRMVDVPLDATTSVVLAGGRCEPEVKHGTGADLGELFAAFDTAYQTVVAPLLAGGQDEFAVAEAIAAAPAGGFIGEAALCGDLLAGALRFQYGDAPTLLLQVLTKYVDASDSNEPLTPTALMVLNGVDVRGGVPTYYFYAGFYS
jgi:hypothetical protein